MHRLPPRARPGARRPRRGANRAPGARRLRSTRPPTNPGCPRQRTRPPRGPGGHGPSTARRAARIGSRLLLMGPLQVGKLITSRVTANLLRPAFLWLVRFGLLVGLLALLPALLGSLLAWISEALLPRP